MSLAIDENFLFGDQSKFSRTVRESDLTGRIDFLRKVKLAFDNNQAKLKTFFLNDNPPKFRVDQLLLLLFELQSKWVTDQSISVVDDLRTAILFANDFLGVDRAELLTSNPEATSDIRTHRGTVMDAFQELRKELGETSGYGLVLDFLERTIGKKYLPARVPQQSSQKAVTPALFFDSRGQRGGVGHVLWLEVELFSDYAGFCIPDILAHGMTDIKILTSEMNEVWISSGLAKDFRAVWRFVEKYPGDHADFVEFEKSSNRKLCLPSLSGRSIQAAALAALWAASGRIPLPKRPEPNDAMDSKLSTTEYFTLDSSNKSFRLTPFVAITASIHPDGKPSGSSAYETQLSKIEKVGLKVNAASKYAVNQDPNDSMFDTVIVCDSDRSEAEEVVTEIKKKTTEGRAYRGVEIMSSCTTIGDALNWMLEVNIWKHAYNEHCREEWESSWGDARNEHGEWLDKETGKYAENTPIERRINTGTIEFMKNEWAQVAGAQNTGQEDTNAEEPRDIEVDPNKPGN